MESNSSLNHFLHYGSLVTIKTHDDFYLYSRGFIDITPILQDGSDHVTDFFGSVFRIVPQCISSTQKEILRYISDSQSGILLAKLNRLEEAFDGEVKTNIHTYNNFKGIAIKYGSLVQLEHIQSHRFLTLKSQQSAEVERENLKLSLEDYGSEYSHFRIEPSYKYQKEGTGLVRLNEKVHFEIMIPELNRVGFLHASKSSLVVPPISRLLTGMILRTESQGPNNSLEINVSLDKKTRWVIDLYSPFVRDINQYNFDEISQEMKTDKNNRQESNNTDEGIQYLACGDYIWLTRSEEEVCLSAGYKQSDSAAIKIVYSDNLTDTNGLWLIENDEVRKGGLITIGKSYRLKHISTGRYLMIKEKAKPGPSGEKYKLKLGNHDSENNLWKLETFENKRQNSFIQPDELCRLVNVNCYEATITGKDSKTEKSIASFIPLIAFVKDELSYFKVSRAGVDVVWETLFLLHCYPILYSFPEYMERYYNLAAREGGKSLREFEKYIMLIQKCIEDLELFCNNKLQSMVGMDNQYGEVQFARQKMLKEHRFFEALTEILNCVFKTKEERAIVMKIMNIETMSINTSIDRKEPFVDIDIDIIRARMLIPVVKKIYQIICTICNKNKENQNYAFSFFKIFINHAGLGLGATNCMLGILKDHEKLLLQIHDPATISKSDNIIMHYAKLLKKYYRNKKPQLLDFLSTICSFKGDGVTVNQEKVYEYIFSSPNIYQKALIPVSVYEETLYVSLGENRDEVIPLDSCFDGGIIVSHYSEIIYFNKLLELFANMCLSRNFICTESLKDHFSQEILQIMMWNNNISNQFRAAFCKLLLTIHIDTYPREESIKPELIKVINMGGSLGQLETLSSPPNKNKSVSFESKESYRRIMKKGSIFAKVQGFAGNMLKIGSIVPEESDIVRFTEQDMVEENLLNSVLEYFNSQASSPNYDIFTEELLRLADKLVRFELYGTECTDFHNHYTVCNSNSVAFSTEKMDIVRFLKSVAPLYFYVGKSIQAQKRKSELNLKMISNIFFKSDPNEKKRTQKKNKKAGFLMNLLNDNSGLSNPVIRCASNLRNFLNSLKQSTMQNVEVEDSETKIKIRICKIFHYYMDWRQEFLISNISQWFSSLEYDKSLLTQTEVLKNLMPEVMEIGYIDRFSRLADLVSDIYTNKFKQCSSPLIPDLNIISNGSVIHPLLMIFKSSSDYKLQSLTLSLIIRCFKQREELTHSIKKLYVISTADDKLLLAWLKENLKDFKQESEQSELWLNYWKHSGNVRQKYYDKFQKIMKFLINLDHLFYEDTKIESNHLLLGNKVSISKERQDILYYLSAHTLIIRLLKDGMHTLVSLYESPNKEIEEPRALLSDLFKQCHKILRKFVYCHSNNQKRLCKDIHVFLQHLKVNVDQIPLICEIYKDNIELISSINKDILKPFKMLIYNEGRQPAFLEFLEIIQTVKGTPVIETQSMVMNFFFKVDYNRFLLFMNDEVDPEFSFESKKPNSSSWTYQDVPYEYHARLINVISLCGFGVNGMYINESKCQKILKVQSLIKLLVLAEDKNTPYYVLKIPLLDFLFNIYIDTEKINQDVKLCSEFFAYIREQAKTFANKHQLDSSYLEFLNIWIKILTKYCSSYLNNRDLLSDKEDFASIQFFAQMLIDNHQVFYTKKLTPALISSLTALCDRFNLEFGSIIYDESSIIIAAASAEGNLRRGRSRYDLIEKSNEVSSFWNEFKNNFIYSDSMKACLKQEWKALIVAIYKIEEFVEELTFESFVQALVNYIRLSRSQHPSIEILINAIELLGSLISEQVVDKYDDVDEEKLKIQDEINACGASKVALTLMCDKETDPRVFASLLDFSINLLDGGNQKIQCDFYQFFVNVPNSEIFFERIHKLFLEKIEKLSKGHINESLRIPIYKARSDKIVSVLRLLQLFCEGHYSKLQKYIRHQEKSRVSYDLIADCISLLEILTKKLYLKTFPVISQCFDSLTEFIQGPCLENQESIIDGKFLELASNLLSLDESSDKIQTLGSIFSDKFSRSESMLSGNIDINERIKGWMVSHLKYKCMITIHSLLEGRNDNYIVSRMIRSFNIELFKENLINIYKNFIELYKKPLYDYEIFNHTSGNDDYDFSSRKNPQDENPDYYMCVIEVGFMIFHLIRIFQENDDREKDEIADDEFFDLEDESKSSFFGAKLIEGLGKFGVAFLKDAVKVGANVITKSAKLALKSEDRKEEIDKFELLGDAYDFFGKYTGSIELMFHDVLTKVYFSLPPEFGGLGNEIKEEFHYYADRTSDQTKLKYLIVKSDAMIEQIKHDYWLKKLFDRQRMLALIASNISLWRDLAFMMTILLNLIIVLSYSSYGGDDAYYSPSFLYYNSNHTKDGLSKTQTLSFIRGIGIVQLVCCCLIVSFFLLKKGPVLAVRGWREKSPGNDFWRKNPSKFQIALRRIHQSILTVTYIFSIFDVWYYIGYMTISCLGIAVHPFFFTLLMLDMLHTYPSLQNVIKAIVRPRKALTLTFLFSLVIVYIFGIIGFWKYHDDFNGDCKSLYMCTVTIFDKGFKNNGGIGAWLTPWKDGSLDYGRFFYDNAYNIIIMIIMLNIVQGIIIDTFAILREEHERNTDDRENKCFICGIEREDIERATKRPFKYHTLREHEEWNYILYISYLKAKDETEYTGIESYVREQIDCKDFMWVPQHRALSIKEDENTENKYLLENASIIEGKLEDLKDKFKSFNRESVDEK